MSPLSGVRVLDLSAYLAGPVASLVLAELGADVIKVEPVSGDAHRGVEPMFAAGQRGKRALALDLKSPAVEPVLRRLFEWSDVVHHNSRVGLAERLRYDEATVRTRNPTVIYSHASGFGPRGPRARTPANDHLMQALSGIEAEAGGDGQPPTSFSDWAAVDIVGGWLSASAVLAALYARRRTGRGQSVWTSLLGAGMTMRSGAFLADGGLVEGPRIDPQQWGYGAAYRIYQCQDGRWLALAIPDGESWARLRRVVGPEILGPAPPPLRVVPGERQPAEVSLEKAFAGKGASWWAEILRAAGVPVEIVREPTRAEFIADIFDDPVSRQLGRVVSFQWGDRGLLEQAACPIRLGPQPRVPPDPHLPTIGEHSHAILESLGFDREERSALAEADTIAGPA